MENRHTGSNFHDFLDSEGILEEVQAMATEKILMMERSEATKKVFHYLALFKETDEAIEVEFPDLGGCVTFGDYWDTAIEHATDALTAWLAHAEPQFIPEPSSQSVLRDLKGVLVLISVDKQIVEQYSERRRIAVEAYTKKQAKLKAKK